MYFYYSFHSKVSISFYFIISVSINESGVYFAISVEYLNYDKYQKQYILLIFGGKISINEYNSGK